MQVKIQVRGDDGKYRNSVAGEFAEASIKEIIRSGNADGWWFLRLWLCKVCLKLAERHSDKPETADSWIKRYQAIRGIE